MPPRLPLLLVGVLFLSSGCRRDAVGPSPRGGAFAADEQAVAEAIRRQYGDDVQFIRWGPHYRHSPEDVVRNPMVAREGDTLIRVVCRSPRTPGEVSDVLVFARYGKAAEYEDTEKRKRTPVLPNLFGDDWIRRMQEE